MQLEINDIAICETSKMAALLSVKHQIAYHLFDCMNLQIVKKAKWQPRQQSKEQINAIFSNFGNKMISIALTSIRKVKKSLRSARTALSSSQKLLQILAYLILPWSQLVFNHAFVCESESIRGWEYLPMEPCDYSIRNSYQI